MPLAVLNLGWYTQVPRYRIPVTRLLSLFGLPSHAGEGHFLLGSSKTKEPFCVVVAIRTGYFAAFWGKKGLLS